MNQHFKVVPMKNIKYALLALTTSIITFLVEASENRFIAELGLLENSFNQVRVPGDDGTRFNMRKSLDDSPYFRLDFKKFYDKHGFRLLYAPLRLTGDRTYGKDINFNGEVFNQNQKTDTLYQFNSYRASYFYQWVKEENWKVNVGLTGKVRDANIELKQGSKKKSRKDLGFVPLLYVWSEYWFTKNTKFTLDFDGLAAPQGRAFDVAAMVGHRLSPSVIANLGYRMLEGGVDNDKVYNFSQFNFYFAAIEVEF